MCSPPSLLSPSLGSYSAALVSFVRLAGLTPGNTFIHTPQRYPVHKCGISRGLSNPKSAHYCTVCVPINQPRIIFLRTQVCSAPSCSRRLLSMSHKGHTITTKVISSWYHTEPPSPPPGHGAMYRMDVPLSWELSGMVIVCM